MAITWTSAFGRVCGWLLDPLVHGLALTRVSPNALTFIGLVINIVAAVLFGHANATNAGRMFFYAGLVIFGAGAFDMLDGRVARRNNQVATPTWCCSSACWSTTAGLIVSGMCAWWPL